MAMKLTKIFGSKHERELKRLQPAVQEINDFIDKYKSLSDEQIQAKTGEFRERLSGGETCDDIMSEAFAVVSEACRRLKGHSWMVSGRETEWDMVPYDVQLIGGIALHEGKIAEMATGEGKTLVATMPLYLNALDGKGAHLVTVNDYLARRDAEWMGGIFRWLGLDVGIIQHDMMPDERRSEYGKDITYGTNNEFGFDYLRDNMAIMPEHRVQRKHHYAIVDEVDSVLVDEARTPLIISGPVDRSTHKFDEYKPKVHSLVKAQTRLVNSLFSEAERLLEEAGEEEDSNKEYSAGVKFLLVQRGAPKHNKLMKLKKETGIIKLIERIENDYLREKKMHVLDDDLLYVIDEKANTVDLQENGRTNLSPNDPELFVLPDLSEKMSALEGNVESGDVSNETAELEREKIHREYADKSERLHNIHQLLKAYALFEIDVDYVVQDGQVLIVDEFTGRLMPGRRFSEGLHQALEAKEGVKIEKETQTLATITIQNYFRMYEKLAGMTGTAETEAGEFWEIYKLDVLVIPTNRPVIRDERDDLIFRTKREKYNALIDEITECYRSQQPVLVGTTSVEVSEMLSRILKRSGVPHEVLNAKQHQREAEIVAGAGQPGAVTIATNMAGRGTDIKLGRGVVELGGLHIIGTERHEARRIDRQLRGRSGRQGDPGSSRFYLSLEDDLMRLFSSDRIAGVMDRLGLEEGEVIAHPMVTKAIGKAQQRVEMQNFGIRKRLLEYDDVMNTQREVIYTRRGRALDQDSLSEDIAELILDFSHDLVNRFTEENAYADQWSWDALHRELLEVCFVDLRIDDEKRREMDQEDLQEAITEANTEAWKRKKALLGEELSGKLERYAILRVIDEKWMSHLYEMDRMKEGISLRAYGQKDPLVEYKSEAYYLFMDMLSGLTRETMQLLFRESAAVENQLQQQAMGMQARSGQAIHQDAVGMAFQGAISEDAGGGSSIPDAPPPGGGPTKRRPVSVSKEPGRNDPCHCGSGKKFKHCHG
ncbi:preprotein translocase subunit SecA [Gemmatimonadota bacterium]